MVYEVKIIRKPVTGRWMTGILSVYDFYSAAGGSLLEAVDVAGKPLGVVETRGMCDERPGASQAPDKAYKVTKQAVLTVPTANLFPGLCPRFVCSSYIIERVHILPFLLPSLLSSLSPSSSSPLLHLTQPLSPP